MKECDYFKKRDDITWKVIEDQVVVVDDAEGKIFRFDAVAATIWIHLEGKQSVRQIAEEVVKIYEVNFRRAEKDVTSFLKRLKGLDLIIEVPLPPR